MQARKFGIAILLLCSLVGLATLFNGLTGPDVAAQSDTEAPHVISIQFEPEFVDTSQSPQLITITVHVTDDLSGVSDMSIAISRYSSSSGTIKPPSLTFNMFSFELVSGTVTNGVYENTMELPTFLAQGRWYVSHISLGDNVQNECSWVSGLGSIGEGCILSGDIPFIINALDDGPPPTSTPIPTKIPTATPTKTPNPAATETAISEKIATAVAATLTAIAEATPVATGTPTP